jgi:hypothetical protein
MECDMGKRYRSVTKVIHASTARLQKLNIAAYRAVFAGEPLRVLWYRTIPQSPRVVYHSLQPDKTPLTLPYCDNLHHPPIPRQMVLYSR